MAKHPYAEFKQDELILRDYLSADRTVLANERTFLAYVRTALAFGIAGGSSLYFITSLASDVVGGLFLFFAAVTFVVGVYRYLTIRRRLEKAFRSVKTLTN